MGRFISEPVDDEMDDPFRSLNEKAEKALAYYKETEVCLQSCFFIFLFCQIVINFDFSFLDCFFVVVKGVEYELVNILAAQPAPVGPFLVLHLNFVGVEKGNAVHGYLKLFFAEVFIGSDEIVNCCVILNARSSGMLSYKFFI